MRFRPRRSHGVGEGEGLPLTSLIDVVFLLLVFFMVTSDFSAPERRLASAAQLEGGGAPSALQPQVVTVEVRGGGVVYTIGEHAVASRNELVEILRRLPTEQGLAVRVRDDVPLMYAAALQAATDAGFERRSYVPATR